MKHNFNAYILMLLLGFSVIYGCSDILEEDISDEKIVLTAPLNNYTTANQSVNFLWEPILGVNYYSLRIVSPAFDSIRSVVLDTILEGSIVNMKLPYGQYEWEVIGYNDAYTTKCCSVNLLRIQSDSSSNLGQQFVTLQQPLDNNIRNIPSIFFEWATLSAAEKYVFQIGNFDFSTLYLNTETLQNKSSFNLPNDGTYYWRVRGVNETTFTFTPWSRRKIVLDRLSPSKPEIIFPLESDSVVIASRSPDMEWISSSDTVVDTVYIYNNAQKDILLLKLPTSIPELELNGTPLDGLSGYQSFFWQVVSQDAAGNTSTPSSLLKFWAK